MYRALLDLGKYVNNLPVKVSAKYVGQTSRTINERI